MRSPGSRLLLQMISCMIFHLSTRILVLALRSQYRPTPAFGGSRFLYLSLPFLSDSFCGQQIRRIERHCVARSVDTFVRSIRRPSGRSSGVHLLREQRVPVVNRILLVLAQTFCQPGQSHPLVIVREDSLGAELTPQLTPESQARGIAGLSPDLEEIVWSYRPGVGGAACQLSGALPQ